jgi:hypothetical protein
MTGRDIAKRISNEGITIYDPITPGSNLWIPPEELEYLLGRRLRGLNIGGLPLRTRSKIVKQNVCKALGYPVPATFTKTQPRFPGQNFDTYIQKSNNLQIWNEEISINRRYVLVRVSEHDVVESVKVVTGNVLEKLDTTGTLTQKFQARLVTGEEVCELITEHDTENLISIIGGRRRPSGFSQSPIEPPQVDSLMPIKAIFKSLRSLIGAIIAEPGIDQERNRGAVLHHLICERLGYRDFKDDGQFPDIRNQLLEVKLQTSPTIDLGLVRPNSTEILDIPAIEGRAIRHCDVRYVLLYGVTDGRKVRLTNLYLTTGEEFFARFPQFQGKVLNKKLQIPLPSDFFG